MAEFRYLSTMHPNTFTATEVSATGRQSFSREMLHFLGIGIMVDVLKQIGTVHYCVDEL